MKSEIDMEYLLRVFERIVNTPSPVGYYEEMNPVITELAGELGYSPFFDNKETAYIELPGEDDSRTVQVGAHLDTIGLMIRRIDNDGMIRVRNLGGNNFASLEGETVHIVTRDGRKYSGLMAHQSHSVHAFDDARTAERNEDTMMIIPDEDVHSKAEVNALGIRNGDVVYAEPRYELTGNGYVKSRFIDDKAAVACCFAVMKYLKDNGLRPKYRTLFAFPYSEEINIGGTYLPPEVSEFVAMDIGILGPDSDGNERSVSICAKDTASPYDRKLTNRLIEKAEKCGLDHAVDVFYRYGTDGSAALRAGNNVRAAAFGMAVYCSHGRERTHVKGLEATAQLLLAYVLDI